jgi:hypothetical protein
MEQIAEISVSIRADGTIKFDRRAVDALGGRGIEYVSFVDERTNRTTGRWLTAQEKRALRKGATRRRPACTRDRNHVRLRDVVRNSAPVRRLARQLGRPVSVYELGNTHYRDFLRDVGIKVRNDRRYEARWWNQNSDQLIVRIK